MLRWDGMLFISATESGMIKMIEKEKRFFKGNFKSFLVSARVFGKQTRGLNFPFEKDSQVLEVFPFGL